MTTDSQSTSVTATNMPSSQTVLLRLYHFVDTNLSSKENLSIVRVSAVQGSLSWISKLKKLLIAKERPKQIN